jgi:2,5-dihydroxypyridine 5,6-dioxygenase
VNRFPLSYNVTAELIPLFKGELEACKIKAGDTVALFTDPRTNPHYPAAFFGAAKELGAHVFQIVVPYMTKSTATVGRAYSDDVIPSVAVLEAMKPCTLVVDMSTVGWLQTNVHNEVLKAGARTLMVKEPEEVLRRMKAPDPDVVRRALAGAQAIEAAKSIRVTSPAGTDLRFDKTGRPGKGRRGFSDVPGHWGHWPSGQITCAPLEGSAEGVLVVGIGDIMLRLERYVEEPIRCTFEKGRMTTIDGGLDAMLLKEYLAAWKDERAYIPAHVGWGIEHRCIWYTMALRHVRGGVMDAESFYGNVLLGMGANFMGDLGGATRTPAHMDFCLRNCDFYLDGRLIVTGGEIVAKELK